MTALVADVARSIVSSDYEYYLVAAGVLIYKGAAVGVSADTLGATPLSGNMQFLGFAEAHADNLAGSFGAVRVRVQHRGKVELAVVGVASMGDIGLNVYASDDNTFSLNGAGATSRIGNVLRVESIGIAVVVFDASVQFT